MRDAVADLSELELSTVEAAVGATSYKRGRTYATGGRVLKLEWDPEIDTLLGRVIGNGAVYDTAASFAPTDGGALTFAAGDCTCPVGYNCKHVAAIVIAAKPKRDQGVRSSQRPPSNRVAARLEVRQPASEAAATHSPSRPAAPPTPAPPSWERSLRALLGAPSTAATGSPMAITLGLSDAGPNGAGSPQLIARLMRQGARGGWINGSLVWNELEPYRSHVSELRDDHVDLARELYGVHSRGSRNTRYSYSAQKTLNLAVCENPQVWSVLDEAHRLGLRLLHAQTEFGEVRCHRGELVIDVTRPDDGEFLVRADLRLSNGDAGKLAPVLLIGTNGHGVVCAERASVEAGEPLSGCRLALVRLERPIPPPLQEMLLEGQSLTVPADELQRFAEEISPELRQLAPVDSSDGSFVPPEISAPALTLRAHHFDGHAVEIGWEWAYTVGSTTRRTPLTLTDGHVGFRDLDAERALLDGTVLRETGLGAHGLLDGAGRPLARPPVLLTGLEVMRLMSDELPLIERLAGVSVESDGTPADYRDVDDLLEIGVSTHEIAGDRDWFDLGVTITVEGEELPFARVFSALARGESRMLLDDGRHFSLLAPRLQSLRQLIEEARGLSDRPGTGVRISRYHAGLWEELAALGIVTEQAVAWQHHVDALLSFDASIDYEPPATLAATLRPYQRDGFAWLASLWELGLGGILADDMGLGKTVQALGLACHLHATDPGIGPVLVVAPTSVVSNWVTEAGRFAPDLRVVAVTDTLRRSGRAIEAIASAADLVVTTYTLLRLDADAYNTVTWAGVILDEAQFVKNHRAKTYATVRRLAAPFKLAITGTPMENNLMELWSLLSITAPGLFPDPKRFAEQYARPIERGEDEGGERLARLRRRIRPLVKRRTKELVATDLPSKQEQTLEVELPPLHRKLYDTHLQRERQKILGLIGDFDRNRFTILRSITLLRQLSLHPGLVDARHDSIPSAKLDALVEQLEDVIGGAHRALVFSQFTSFLAKIKARLDQEGVSYCYLDGRTRKRDTVMKRFQDGRDPVFLISLKAGGFGLNLTEADYVFLLDPWWNPATEAQAIDRTHRIGQTRPVMVYRMIAANTIEQKVVALAARKAELFRGVMDDGDLYSASLTAEDIIGLLG
jgi:superfamily II DNA or RNA helicase